MDMGTHIVIDGNAFYEVDDDCLTARRGRKDTEAGEAGENAKMQRNERTQKNEKTQKN